MAAGIEGLVLVPGLTPGKAVEAYVKHKDGSLRVWGAWDTWRDAYCFLDGYTHGERDMDPDFRVKD